MPSEQPPASQEPASQEPTAQATIVDVALRAGVSVATVSRALRNYPNVASATRDRVLQAAGELSYVADTNASRLASGRSNTIGVLAPILTSWYTGEVIAGVEEVLRDAELDLLISTRGLVDRRDAFEVASAFRQRVDGMILVDAYFHDEGARMNRAGIPTVVVGEHMAAVPSLSIDDRLGGEMATRHLLELGHRRVGLIGGLITPDVVSAVLDRRLAGFHAALAAGRLRRDRSLIAEGNFTIEGGRRAARQLLANDNPPTAIFCLSDEMAFGAIQAARELGLSIPRDLSLIGFDDHPVAEAIGLSTIRQPVRDMGRVAARLVADIIDGHEPVSRHLPQAIALVARSSTAAPSR